ncbi:anti-phage Hailong system effector protein HalA [Serratia marcescens]|uniref:anti-phage Hailong system effector protein HalA n=1 Tax=Serratia marcescens TaxID=615 RepID=UPI002932B0E2|nr:pentapeptide repeat-containing protein [Serratia marcescens]MDV2100107.1 pentapeptide repeat-containing protein [Serratia marcescens]
MNNGVRQHRIKNYWDVTYDSQIKLEEFIPWGFDDLNINGRNNSGPRKVTIDLTIPDQIANSRSQDGKIILTKIKSENFKNKFFEGYVFTECDIYGDNKGVRITFKKCEFRKVCFGYANFKNIKFIDCIFNECSFSMASFENCQFNNCIYNDISYSGNETKLKNTYIEPGKFINSLFVRQDKDILEKEGATPEYQKYRSYGTKTKCSKVVLNSLSTIPDDEAYYQAVEVHFKCKQISKQKAISFERADSKIIKKTWYSLLLLKSMVENFIINTSGLINGWGGGLFRCVFVGLFIMIMFAGIYSITSSGDIIGSLMKSVDITLLTGYTKYSTQTSTTGAEELSEVIHLINMMIGVWWYGILIPTLINKICTSRT